MPALPFFFPTRVVLIDDEPQVLRTTSLLFERRPEVAEVLSFASAVEAQGFLREDAAWSIATDPFAQARVSDEIDDESGITPRVRRTVEIDLSAPVIDGTADPSHLPISVIVCDYAMPGIDGLEFFAGLRDGHVRRVLLTALCDDQRAVQAFNHGLIHRFVHKADAAGPRGLERILAEQIRQFFVLRSAHLGAALALGSAGKLLKHPGVPGLLEFVMRETGFLEYRFSVAPSGFRLRKRRGEQAGQEQTLIVIVAVDEDFARTARVVREIEAPAELERALLQREVMTVGRDGDPIYEAGADWARFAVEPRVLRSADPLYWAQLGTESAGRGGAASA